MPIALDNGIKNANKLAIKNLKTNTLLVFPTATDIEFNPNIKEEVIMKIAETGKRVPSSIIQTEEDPQINFKMRKTLEGMAMALGRDLATAPTWTGYIEKFFIPSKLIYPGATLPTQEGFGMLADQIDSTASVRRNMRSVKLTRLPFATFTGATADTFAQGANGAFAISQNIIDAQEAVGYKFSVPLNLTTYLSELISSEYQVHVGLIFDDLTTARLEFSNMTPIMDGLAFNFNEATFNGKFRALDTGEKCMPYTLYYTGRAPFCAAA